MGADHLRPMYTAVYIVHGRVYVPYTWAVNGVYTVYTGRKHGRVQVFTAHVLGRLRPVHTGRKHAYRAVHKGVQGIFSLLVDTGRVRRP